MTPYYDRDGITLFLGDCLDIIPVIGDVDLVVTDPPYNVGIKYDSKIDDRLEDDQWIDWSSKWLLPCIEQSATTLVSTGHRLLPLYAKVAKWKWLLAWHKPAAMGRSPVGFNNWEPIAMYGKGVQTSVDIFSATIKPDKSINGHPCPKPLAWAKHQLHMFPKYKTVLDPFAGAGTTLVAARQMGINATGIELSEEYCKIAVNRLRQRSLAFSY
jgi:site-specific DNA-methyltransferase (adenine-specific)